VQSPDLAFEQVCKFVTVVSIEPSEKTLHLARPFTPLTIDCNHRRRAFGFRSWDVAEVIWGYLIGYFFTCQNPFLCNT